MMEKQRTKSPLKNSQLVDSVDQGLVVPEHSTSCRWRRSRRLWWREKIATIWINSGRIPTKEKQFWICLSLFWGCHGEKGGRGDRREHCVPCCFCRQSQTPPSPASSKLPVRGDGPSCSPSYEWKTAPCRGRDSGRCHRTAPTFAGARLVRWPDISLRNRTPLIPSILLKKWRIKENILFCPAMFNHFWDSPGNHPRGAIFPTVDPPY